MDEIKYDKGLEWNPDPMLKRVSPYEDVQESLDRIPFLRRFNTAAPPAINMSSEKLNAYMGFPFIETGSLLRSADINKVLEEAEKRGDL